MLNINKLFAGILAILLLCGCEVDIEKSVLESSYCTGTVNAGELNTTGFRVESLLESTVLGHGNFTIQTFSGEYPQYLSVNNQNGEPVLLYRQIIKGKGEIEINAFTTAIAALTFHPVLGTVVGDEYDELVNIISSTEHFDAYLSAVEQSIAGNRNIYDTSNTQLINAAKDVFSDLLGDTTRLYYDGTDDAKATSPLTELYGCWPIDVRSEGNKLKFRVPGCCPSYWCTVYDEYSNATGEKFVVPTRENFGALNVIKCLMGQCDWLYGEQATYTFPDVNEPRTFHFDRGNLVGHTDKYLQLASCVFQMLGVKYDNKILNEVSFAISEALTVIEGGSWQDHIWNIVSVAIDASLNVLSKYSSNIGTYASNLNIVMKWINLVEGGGNILLRTVWNFLSELEYTFCSQYYSNHSFGLCPDYFLELDHYTIENDPQYINGAVNFRINVFLKGSEMALMDFSQFGFYIRYANDIAYYKVEHLSSVYTTTQVDTVYRIEREGFFDFNLDYTNWVATATDYYIGVYTIKDGVPNMFDEQPLMGLTYSKQPRLTFTNASTGTTSAVGYDEDNDITTYETPASFDFTVDGSFWLDYIQFEARDNNGEIYRQWSTETYNSDSSYHTDFSITSYSNSPSAIWYYRLYLTNGTSIISNNALFCSCDNNNVTLNICNAPSYKKPRLNASGSRKNNAPNPSVSYVLR